MINGKISTYTEKGNLSFFSEWECDEDMRTYDKCGYYPPPIVPPSNHHNLWTGFPIEDIPYNPNISIKENIVSRSSDGEPQSFYV